MTGAPDNALFDFQADGANWLSTRRFALLADEMGLGKSAQAIVAADTINAQRILILCPASIRINWTRELMKFSARTPKRTITCLLDGTTATGSGSTDVMICSYDLATTNASVYARLAKNFYDLLILDEVHYLKSVEAKRAHAVLGKGGLIHRAARTWALSGTPTPNHAGELYPLARCFGMTKLTWDDYLEKFCRTRKTAFGTQIVGSRNIPELRKLLAPFTLRRRKEEVMSDMPAIVFSDLVVEAGPVDEEMLFAEDYLLDRVDKLHAEVDSSRKLITATLETTGMGQNGLVALSALQPNTSKLRQLIGMQKLEPLTRIITEELESGAYEKILVFCIHRHLIEGFRQSLAKFKPVTLYGGTVAEKRQKHIDTFINNPKCRVFIGNITAAGVGIDGLQKVCHNVLMAECDWVPGNNAQAVMRVHRIGQTKPVSVRVAAVADSLDEQIQRVLRRKIKEIVDIWD